MDVDIKKFCKIVKKRSEENMRSFKLLHKAGCYGNCVSILRQELDSYIRVIYLHMVKDDDLQKICIENTLNGKRWKITDAEMLKKVSEIDGWEQMVYKLGCSCIHLSNFHNYATENPFKALFKEDQEVIRNHVKWYHNIDVDLNNFETIIPVLPLVMEKISENLQDALSGKDGIEIYWPPEAFS